MNTTDPQYAQLSITKMNPLATDNVMVFKKFPNQGLVSVSLGIEVQLINYFNIMFKKPATIEALVTIGDPNLAGPNIKINKPDRTLLSELQVSFDPQSLSRTVSYGFHNETLPQVFSSWELPNSPFFIPHGITVTGQWFNFSSQDILSLFNGDGNISLIAFSSTLSEIKDEIPQGGFDITFDGLVRVAVTYSYIDM